MPIVNKVKRRALSKFTFLNLFESFWIFWNLLESFEIIWNLLESFRISETFITFWNLSEYFRIWDSYASYLEYSAFLFSIWGARGHREGGRLGLVKNFKTVFFKRYCKVLPRKSQQIQSLETSKVSAVMGCCWQAGRVMVKMFLSNLHTHLMNKSWKFQKDILILVWFMAK